MSKAGAVEVKGVAMPMIDDQVDADDGLPKAILPQAQKPQPKNVREAYLRVRTTKDFAELCAGLTILCGLICAGLCLTIVMVALSLVNLFLLIVGAIHIKDCPTERFIPIFLVVVGVFTIVRAILNWYYAWCHPKIKKAGSTEEVAKPSPFTNIINLFLLVWLICGAVWVFRANVVFDDPSSFHYCDKLTYHTAYVYVIISLALLALSLVLACCFGACIICGIVLGAAADAANDSGQRGDRNV